MMLEQLLGLYFIIIGVVVLYRRRAIMPAISQLAANRGLLLAISLAEILAGLAIVITYPDLTLDSAGLVSVIGWMLIVEGIIYLAAPNKSVQKTIRRFNREHWFRIGGVGAILIGGYLAGVGFGFF